MPADETKRNQRASFHTGEQTLAKVVTAATSPAAADKDDPALRIAQLIDRLPDQQQRALRLRHLENWSLEKIAGELDRPPAQVARLLIAGALELSRTASIDSQADAAASQPLDDTIDIQANDTLAEYLQAVDGGSADAPQSLIAESPQSSGELQAYFEVAEQLDRAAYMMTATLAPTDARRDTTVTTDTLPTTPGMELAGPTIGDYELLNMIGVGGMGIVYKARQKNLNRLVALKMIRTGQFADRHEVERFQAEAEAAAGLRHPHIVSVHEVGESDGHHYFTMDYVEGKALDDLIRQNTLPPRQAAELVKTIAETIHFAHERGILHRDIKPANILLDETQDQRPLLTDFGLAKRFSDESGTTMTGAIVGTPSYAAPEQLSGRPDQLGPVSDVYGLGALLYELLAGRPPFRASTPLETVRLVLDTEPASPRLLNPNVPRDLETICLKCLQKEPSARYSSAAELAAELDRFVEGKPILARPISRTMRAWRWCRRNPKIAASLAAAVVGVIAAFVATVIGYASTSSALAETEQARQSEATAKEEAQDAQERDEASFLLARDAVDELFTEVSENILLNQPGMQPLRQDLLRRSLKYYERFLVQRAGDEALLDELALAQYRVGLITETIGSAEDALDALEQARIMQEQLVQATPHNADRRYALSNTQTTIGVVYFKMQELHASLQAHRAALEIREKLAEASPSNVEYQRKLANSRMNIAILDKALGRLDEASRGMELAQEIRLETLDNDSDDMNLKRDLGKGYFNLANLALILQDRALDNQDQQLADEQLNLAIENLRQAVKVFQKQVEQHPHDFTSQIQLATCYSVLADLRSFQGRSDETARSEAIQLYDDAQPILESLARLNPDVARYQATLAGLYLSQAVLYAVDQKATAALPAYEQGRHVLQGLVDRYPAVPVYQRDLANALRAIASVHAQLRQWQAARDSLDAAMTLLETLVAAHPQSGEYTQLLDQAKADLRRLDELQSAATQ